MPAINTLPKITNAEFWNMARGASPSFASHTAEATADLFTERGFEQLARTDINAVNEFLGISLRVAFQKIDVSRARNPLTDSGLVEVYSTPNGGYVQRMSIDSIKPTSPRFKGLADGQSVDPYTVRKPTTHERFYAQNFDYQSFITVQDFQVKTIFVDEYGVGQWIAGIMTALANGYTIQEYENTLAALNTALNSDTTPLKETQLLSVDSWTGDGTADELKQFILFVKNVASEMTAVTQTSAYNANSFSTVVDTDDYVMLVRPGLKNRIAVELEVGAFNPDRLSLPFEVKEVENFGGLIPYYHPDDEDVRLYPHYDANGAEDGWSLTEDGDKLESVPGFFYQDPNSDVLAVIAQKGVIFENRQNGYMVNEIYNPAGLYRNYWASSPNNSIVYDANYNLVTISKPQA